MKGNKRKAECEKTNHKSWALLRTCPQKGITLIVLIITIIVMIILVGVTITVSLNGGLFENATKATIETQKEIERERLTEIALASYNALEGKISDTNGLIGKVNNIGFSKDEEKSSNTKLVVNKTETLWQIDLNTAEVSEYINIYGVAYKGNLGEILEIETYFFENGLIIWNFTSSTNAISCFKAEISNQREMNINETKIVHSFGKDYNTCKFKIGESDIDVSKTDKYYNYNPTLNENIKLYTNNAIYLSDESVIWINNDIGTWSADEGLIDMNIPIEELETREELVGQITNSGYTINISEDGKIITLDGIQYSFIEEL